MSVSPSSSFPITEKRVVDAPNETVLSATLAAPPKRNSFLSKATTGTGASGDILSTCPHQ